MISDFLIKTPTVFGENGNFLLERELGVGGMGGVYLGRDKMLDRPVAVKVMLKEYGSDASFVEKFKKEAQAAARLIHPNIAQIYSYGISDGMPYIAMELVAGGSLATVMEHAPGGKTDVARVMKLCEQVAQALRCASDQGLVHGDVKPENILLDANGNAKLVDFGLAAMQKNTDEIWGTPYYIAPEKVLKESFDYRADMYSLGATMYHALCGVAPFEGDDANAVVKKRLDSMPKTPSETRPELSSQIDGLVMRMLARNPADRFPTFEALLAEFKKVLTTGLDPVQPRSSAPAAKPFTPSSVSTGARLSVKRPGAKKLSLRPRAAERESREENADGSGGGETAASPQPARKFRRGFKIKGVKAQLAGAVSEDGGGEDSKESSVGFKVFGFAGIMILVVGLVVGALVWYQASVAEKERLERSAYILNNYNLGRDNIVKNRKLLLSFAEEFEASAVETVKDCEKFTQDLRKALAAKYSKNVLAMLVPPATEELKKAVAMTNECPALASTIAAIGADKLVGSAPAGTAADGAKKNVRKHSGFRKPVGDETDPNSEEGIKYLEEKKKWEEARAAGKAAGGKDASGTEAPKEIAVTGTSEEIPSAVGDMRGMWERAYGCQAAAISIRKQVVKLVEDADTALAVPNNDTDENARKVVDDSNALTAALEALRSGDEVTAARKAKNYISSRGKKTVESTLRRLREEAAREQREKEKQERLAREARVKKEMAEAHAKKAAEERAAARTVFASLVEGGTVRQLDWASGKRQLRQLRDSLETVEGELQVKEEMTKIEMMETMHRAMVSNMKGYVFRKGKLAGYAVVDVTDALVTVRKGEGKSRKIAWSEFLQSNIPNFQELMHKYVKNGRKSDLKHKLSAKEWQDAMIGGAMVVEYVCGSQAGADKYRDSLVQEAVKAFPGAAARAKACFPAMTFDASADSMPID
ncbi:MAG: protein kinase [Kiritimatiellae bacterium]|nr:protein kinase [Kiritimatiellia bacterium]